jgi:hypothetical protein
MNVPISDDDRDPAEVERAKRLMSGPLGRELAAYPIRFCESVVFGSATHAEWLRQQRNASIVDLGSGPLAVTCWHVMDGYRRRLAYGPTTCQIGNLRIDPLERLIDEDQRLDLATLTLDGCDFEQIRSGKHVQSATFRPVRWPPAALREGEFVSLGGFPGSWRTVTGAASFDYDTFSIGSTPVTVVRDDCAVCQFERENWIGWHNDVRDFRELGGMSGGPVFVQRPLHAEWVGIIHEFSPSYDLLYFRPATLIERGGRIHRLER